MTTQAYVNFKVFRIGIEVATWRPKGSLRGCWLYLGFWTLGVIWF